MRAGVSVVVNELIRGLSSHYEIVLVSPDRAQDVSIPPISQNVKWDPQAVSWKNSRALARRLAELGVQVAHFHFGGVFGWGTRAIGCAPMPWVARCEIPVVTTIHSARSLLDGFCGPQKPLLAKLALLPAAWLGKADVLRHVRTEVTVSYDNLEKLRRWYWPFRNRFRQIYHSRIHVTADDVSARPTRDNIILSVGYISLVKGQDLLAEAFARIAPKFPQWKLVLVGHTSEEAALSKIREIIHREKLEGRISIFANRDDIASLIKSAAIFALPSLHEGLGLALQEALFHGCACVGSRSGGIPELIEDGCNGLLVRPGNIEELAIALERLIRDEALRREFGARGRESILEKNMTANRMVESYRRIYESILA